jgi:hypothetical protein
MNITQKIKSRITRRKNKPQPRTRKHTYKIPTKNSVPNRMKNIIRIRKLINSNMINSNTRKTKEQLRLNLERELNLHLGLKFLNEKYGPERIMKWYWSPNYIRNGLPESGDGDDPEFEHDIKVIHKSLDPSFSKTKLISKEILNYFVEQVEITTNNIIKKYPALKNISELERYALFRYHVVGALNNISLSVSPETKREWGIDFELFGAFYNTNYDYCGLYSELEKRCVTDVLHFKLEPNMTILINPPYTEEWIVKSCELVNQYLSKEMNTTIWLVVPVWNVSDRKKLRLKIYDDMPILDAMKFSPYLVSHEITNLKFYNGLEKKEIDLKDKVHVYHFSNTSI